MLASSHVAAGAAMSFAFAPTPVGALTAFVAGTGSHLLMDIVPHWGRVDDRAFLKVARLDGLSLLTFSAVFLVLALQELSFGRVATAAMAMFGALLFDLDKPVRHFFRRELWPSPLASMLSCIQTERPWLWPVDVTTGIASATITFMIMY